MLRFEALLLRLVQVAVLLVAVVVPGESVGFEFCNASRLWSEVCRNCTESEGPFLAYYSLDQLRFNPAPEKSACRSLHGFICRANASLKSVQNGNCCKVASNSSSCSRTCQIYSLQPLDDRVNNRTEVFWVSFMGNDSKIPSTSSSIAPSSTSSSIAPSSACKPGEACWRSKKTRRGSRMYIIGGIAVAGVLALAACVVLLALRKRQLKSRKSGSDRAQILVDITGSNSPTVFTFKELKSATKSFSESKLLGGGGFSTVYQGKLPDGRVVAVKKLNQGNKQGIQQFQNEVNILSKVRHTNLVQLLGYCLEGRDLLLVYEYVLNGTLADHLHGERGNPNGLSMETRLSIALDTSQALAYLHFYVNPPIYHRDVKSSNILLDKDFKAKVADFGLSRLTHLDNTHISTAPQGTPGYLDPDYHESYQLTDKSDVYSFGVVLLELVSRKKAVDMTRDKKEINLASMALAKIHSGALHELFDPDLSVKYWKLLTRLVEVAFRCLAVEKDDRPSMIEVVAELEQLSSMGVMSFSSRRKTKLECSGELQKHRSNSNNSNNSNSNNRLEEDSPTSVQIKWPSTHTSPSNSRSEV